MPDTQSRIGGALLASWVAGLAILKVLACGYMPLDDVLRHAAYAMGRRGWDQILIGRPEALFDQSPGWHALLRVCNGVFGLGTEALVVFSILFGFFLFLVSGLLWVRRWEIWVLTLAGCFLCDSALAMRVVLGRPLILTMALLIVLMGAIREEKARNWRDPVYGLWLLGSALVCWVHGSWYLLFLMPVAVALAGRFREGLRLGLVVVLGCLLGASCTGHPIAFLQGQTNHLLHAMGRHADPRSLAMEFQPGRQTLLLPILVLLAGWANRNNLAWRRLRRDPVLVLGVLGWVLGYFTVWRFYLDWAFPALALWMAFMLEEAFSPLFACGWRRWLICVLSSLLFIVALGWNRQGRWSTDGRINGLSPWLERERLLLPKPGGIVYANSMSVFYGMFFLNPDGSWKYVLGYEPGMMNLEDDRVYQSLFQTQDWTSAMAPWVSRMTSKDRMILLGPPNTPPPVGGLLWICCPPNKWVGIKNGVGPTDLFQTRTGPALPPTRVMELGRVKSEGL